MTNQTPKAFDFGDEPEPGSDAAKQQAAPRAFDFGELEDSPLAQPAMPPKTGQPKPLFESEDHPAVRDAMHTIRNDYPLLFEQSEQRMAAMFRRLLPVKLALVTDWGEEALMEQASLLQPITELVRKFADMEVPAMLEAALDSTRPPSGIIDKLLRRSKSPSQFKPELTACRERLVQLVADSEVASRNLEGSASTLTLHWVALAVVAELAGRTPDATLLDVLQQRRTLIQQAVRQAELSVLQMGQVRQQAADLIVQVSSFLTVTLPALEMAQTQGAR